MSLFLAMSRATRSFTARPVMGSAPVCASSRLPDHQISIAAVADASSGRKAGCRYELMRMSVVDCFASDHPLRIGNQRSAIVWDVATAAADRPCCISCLTAAGSMSSSGIRFATSRASRASPSYTTGYGPIVSVFCAGLPAAFIPKVSFIRQCLPPAGVTWRKSCPESLSL